MNLMYIAEPGCEPALGNSFAAGIDLRAKQALKLRPGATGTVGTGLRVKLPTNHVGFVRGRSGLAFRKNVWAFEGTIDEDYTGEIAILLMNNGVEEYDVAKGERVAQLVIVPVTRCTPTVTPFLIGPMGGRGDNGFGSTGTI